MKVISRPLVLCAAATVLAANVPATRQMAPHPDALPNLHAPGVVDRAELVPFIVPDPPSKSPASADVKP
jgi:hypothetical protein